MPKSTHSDIFVAMLGSSFLILADTSHHALSTHSAKKRPHQPWTWPTGAAEAIRGPLRRSLRKGPDA